MIFLSRQSESGGVAEASASTQRKNSPGAAVKQTGAVSSISTGYRPQPQVLQVTKFAELTGFVLTNRMLLPAIRTSTFLWHKLDKIGFSVVKMEAILRQGMSKTGSLLRFFNGILALFSRNLGQKPPISGPIHSEISEESITLRKDFPECRRHSHSARKDVLFGSRKERNPNRIRCGKFFRTGVTQISCCFPFCLSRCFLTRPRCECAGQQ
jgi:hypothetical protein